MAQDNANANGLVPAEHETVTPASGTVNTLDGQIDGGLLATRTKLRARESLPQNRILIVAGGLIVLALVIFAVVSAPHTQDTRHQSESSKLPQDSMNGNEKSVVPVTDSGRPTPSENRAGYLKEKDVARTATKKEGAPAVQNGPRTDGSLGAIPSFGDQSWQAPPYQSAPNGAIQAAQQQESSSKTLDKSSLVFVRVASAEQPKTAMSARSLENLPEVGLPIGSRLRAKLEASASTAVHTPVIAVIQYNYERDGEIVVPSGAKAIGRIQEADRSGYVRIQFDTLLLPDGTSIAIQAAAISVDMRPLKGKVEGKNTGKNILVRSLSGIGEAGALLFGRRSLNEPLNESDLIRERIGNNVGQASDEELARLAVTSKVVVTVPAGIEVYVVLEQSSKPTMTHSLATAPANNLENLDQLRQLLQLQREISPSVPKAQ